MATVKKPLRVYADTSVFGGCFDDEFKTESVQFFEAVRQGQFVVVVSNVTLDELELAPDPVGGVPTCLRSGSRSLARRRSRMASEGRTWRRR